MPCYDGGEPVSNAYLEAANYRLKKTEAFLCAIMTMLETRSPVGVSIILDHVNWEEAGVSKQEFERWWNAHKATDVRRRGI